jgi:hypothetical protein
MSAQIKHCDNYLPNEATNAYRLFSENMIREVVKDCELIHVLQHVYKPIFFYILNIQEFDFLEGFFCMSIIGQLDDVTAVIKLNGLKKVRTALGSINAMSAILGISKNTIEEWFKDIYRKTNFAYPLCLSIHSGIPIEEVSPETPELNRHLSKVIPDDRCSIVLKEIILRDIYYLPHQKESGWIIVDQNNRLICGLVQKQRYEAIRIKRMSVVKINLNDLWLGNIQLEDISVNLLPSEKWAIGICLLSDYGKGRGFRSDKLKNILKNDEKSGLLTSGLTQVNCKKRRLTVKEQIANIFDMSYGQLCNLDRICRSGDRQLIEAVDSGALTINGAVGFLKASQPASQPASQEMLNEYEGYANEYTN